MDGEIRFLSKSKFAAEQGWSPSYVTKLGQQGRLVLCENKKLVNVDATLAMLRRTEDPGKDSVRQHHQAGRVEKHVGAHVEPDAPTDDEPGAAAGADPKYWDNKARREGMLADLAELELAKKRGELVERQRVEAMAFAAGRTLRDAVLGLPTQLAPVFATMTDSFQIEIKLRDALRQVFADAVKMTADDLTRASEQSH
jgi:hypothetical protein